MNGIRILFEDEDVLVLDKPSGITVNRSDTTKGEETVQDWIEKWQMTSVRQAQDKNGKWQMGEDKESDFYKRGGIVHRIDKETSGILLAAKTLHSFENLQKQFKERAVKKTYLALCHGKIVPETGEINVPVGRLPWNRKKFGVLSGGREAVTRYRVISNFKFQISNKKSEEVSFLELYPETGRTHQIRVHLKYLNHPIFADFLYAGRKTSREDRKVLNRVFLHAHKISFTHPVTNKQISIESPLPEELAKIIR